jgi:hypothetical protein
MRLERISYSTSIWFLGVIVLTIVQKTGALIWACQGRLTTGTYHDTTVLDLTG